MPFNSVFNDAYVATESEGFMRTDRPLHDYVMNRDGVYVTKIWADQFLPEMLEKFPSFEGLSFVYEIRTGNGVVNYVTSAEEVIESINIAGEGKGNLSRIWQGMDKKEALEHGRDEYNYWLNKWRGAKINPQTKKKEIDVSLDDLDINDILGDL